VQQISAARLESREIDPPAGFVQLQIAGIRQAMIVTHTMMMEGKLHGRPTIVDAFVAREGRCEIFRLAKH